MILRVSHLQQLSGNRTRDEKKVCEKNEQFMCIHHNLFVFYIDNLYVRS